MKLSFQLVVVLSSVVGTVLIAAEPCEIGEGYGNYGKFDMVACGVQLLCQEWKSSRRMLQYYL